MPNFRNSKIQTIPLYLCHIALTSKKINQLKVYVAIKYDCSGYFIAKTENISRISCSLGISEVTFRKQIKNLVNDRWILKCKAKNTYWIRGYKQMGILLKNTTISCIRFENRDLLSFKALLIGAEYSRLIRNLRRREKNPVRTQGRRTLIRALPPSTFVVSNTYFARAVGISKTTAIEYKTLAENLGYIISNENLYNLNIAPHQIEYYSEASGTQRERIIRKNGKVFYQEPDFIQSRVMIYFRRNLKIKKSDPILGRVKGKTIFMNDGDNTNHVPPQRFAINKGRKSINHLTKKHKKVT